MRILLVIAIAIFTWMNVSAQKNPYFIRNYTPFEYGGTNQTWQIAQDKSGLIYIAGNTEIYTYDGTFWNTIKVKTGGAVRQICYDSTADRMYVGSVSDFGYLQKDNRGALTFVSYRSQLNAEQLKFLDIWKVYKNGDLIYFQSSERIFVVKDDKIIKCIEADDDNTFALMFQCGDQLYVRQRNVGLMEIEGLNISKVPGSEAYGSIRILGMVPVNNNLIWILTGDRGVHEFELIGKGSAAPVFRELRTNSDSILYTSGVLGLEWISSTELAVVSRNGLHIFDSQWNHLHTFDKKSGLNDEAISEVKLDLDGNLWVASNIGVARISYYSRLLKYSDATGYSGTLECIQFANNEMFLGTSEGLYRSAYSHASTIQLEFSPCDGVNTEVWNILPVENGLLLSTSEGLLFYDYEKTIHVTYSYTNDCKPSPDGPGQFHTAERGGFSFISYSPLTGFQVIAHYELPGTEMIRASTVTSTNKAQQTYNFWATTRFKSLMYVTVNLIDTSIFYREYNISNGVPQENYKIVTSNDSIWFTTSHIAYKYVASLDINDSAVCFVNDSAFLHRLFRYDVRPVQTPFDYQLFIDSRTTPYTAFFGEDSTALYMRKVHLGKNFYGNALQAGRIEAQKYLWILGVQSLFLYQLEKSTDFSRNITPLISKVRFKGDSLDWLYPVFGQSILELPYTSNGVTFHFSAPYFVEDMRVYYSYYLEGLDADWESTADITFKEYTNLPEGKYTFHVRVHNSMGIESEEAVYSFTILPPWYRTIWAYTVYILLLLLGVYIIVRLSARRLRQQKERLEQIVKERTAEVVEQKHQIEKQKLDLEEAYTGIQDSIQYSQRIQNAILPTSEEIKRLVPESFVLFYPRDIVSGDFYWFAERSGLTFIACVDCTGHGVPGALMSMIGNTILNQIILEEGIVAPDEILNNLHVGVRRALKQDMGGDTRDGMDLSLIVIDEKKQSIQYAGANRNLWIIRDKMLLETKADKFPIAGSQEEVTRRFHAHTIAVQKNDVIYLTTDGYADQFGGERGKKFMVKQLSRILMEIHQQPMKEQFNVLDHKFKTWKGNHEQVDDVLVIGIRI